MLFSIAPVVGILVVLMLFDLNDTEHMPWSQDPCRLHDTEQNTLSARMYLPIARWALRYTPTPRVAILTVDSETRPASITTNSCDSRAFFARLIQHLNTLSARAIVIDQYFSPDYCAEPEKTQKFIDAVAFSKTPVILGQGTHTLPKSTASGGCLVLSKRLDLPPSSKVSFGITRLVSDDLKIPFRWPVFKDSPDPNAAPQQLPGDSGTTLSFAAAKVVEPEIEQDPSVARVLRGGYYPYTTFIDLPRANAMTVMCSVEQEPHDIFGKKLGSDCDTWPSGAPGHSPLDLNGKIVVIGAVVPSDMKPFPTGEQPGVFLHANYIQSILDHRFLLEVPTGMTLGLLTAFMLATYSLYWAHDRHGNPYLSTTRAALWNVAMFAGAVVISLLILVTTSYYVPLWALWAAAGVSVLRALEEMGYLQSERLGERLAMHREQLATHEAVSTQAPHD
jgi:hypothetical protein